MNYLEHTLMSILSKIAAADPSARGYTITRVGEPDPPAVARDYQTRNILILRALHIALALDFTAGVSLDADDAHPVLVFIELPYPSFGPLQVSWHLPREAAWYLSEPTYPGEYDGHSTIQKYVRILHYVSNGVLRAKTEGIEGPEGEAMSAEEYRGLFGGSNVGND